MTTVQRDKSVKWFQGPISWVFAVCTLGYFLPWAIAATRGKSNTGAIAWLNLLVGWTIIGWFVALVMAFGAHQVVPQTVIVAAPQPQALPASDAAAVAAPAGWYPQADGSQRYWTGSAWQ